MKKIKFTRISKGFSQLEVCARGNFSQSFYTHIEIGKSQPSLMTIIRIAQVLEINPKDFFTETKNRSKQEIKKEIFSLIESL